MIRLFSNLVQFSKANLHEFISTIASTTEILKREREKGIMQSGIPLDDIVRLSIPNNLIIIGDLHGDLETLYTILNKTDFETFLANRNNKMIFLGDYIDRGSKSISVLYTICMLKIRYPYSIVLIRGNHEAPEEFPFRSHDLPQKIIEQFGSDASTKVYETILSLFRLMTLMVIIGDKLLLVHGGLAVEMDNSIKDIHISHNKNTLEEILWSDPKVIQNAEWDTSRRFYGKHFGIPITEKWLRATNTKILVRGHEPCKGYKIDHNGLVLTLFSCKESYPKFEAGYIHIEKKDLISINNATELSCHVRLV